MVDICALPPEGVSLLSLEDRASATLAIAHGRGYALPVGRLSSLLVGGPVPAEALVTALSTSGGILVRDGVAFLRGHEGLLPRTRRRLSSHAGLENRYARLAESYVQELVATVPSVECAAAAGSFSSGGLFDGDDLDINLFVRDGTKFISYLSALILAARYGLGKRGRDGTGAPGRGPANGAGDGCGMPMPLVTKRVCINVVWEASESRPFIRRDAALAFELLNSVPVYNAPRFDEVIDANPWLLSYFPQLAARRAMRDTMARPGARRLVPGLLDGLSRHGMGEPLSRRAVGLLHSLVAGYRRAYPQSRAIAARKETLKHPYGLMELPAPARAARRG